MPTYAILGATGNTGTALIQNILRTPSSRVNAYCRNKAKLLRLLPDLDLAANKSVDIYEGSITDLALIHACIRNTSAVFLVATTNDNIPGCRISQDSVRTVLDALQKIRTEEPDLPLPKLVLLSSATIDPHLGRKMPGWFKPIMKTAASHVYKDLIEAERLMRANEAWVTSIFIKPGGLSVDIQRGHKLDFDEQESFISYLDLAAAMLEAADEGAGLYDGRNINLTASTLSKIPNNYAPSHGQDPAVTLTNQLLQINHDKLHIFFRDLNGHNHLVHNLLTRIAIGATPAQLQTAFDDDLPTQRAAPPVDEAVVANLGEEKYFFDRISQITQYTNFLRFFERKIGNHGDGWKCVVNEYVFSRSRIANAILPLMYDGAYHSIIHLGLGVEFEQPSIIAEALAQAAAHDSFRTDYFFLTAEERAPRYKGDEALVTLLNEIKATPKIVTAAKTPGLIGTMKMKKAVLANAGDEIIDIVARFRVTPETLEKRTAEVLNFCAYLAGSAQRPGYARKIDFFFMHCVTSSIFFSVLNRQDWIAVEDKVRLVEWKGRLDLMWYAICGVPELDIDAVRGYQGPLTGNMGWEELFGVVNEQHDDGHVAKFVRALKNAEEVCKDFEDDAGFMVKGDMWLRIARMAYDSTLETTPMTRWVVMAGMDSAWSSVQKV
ncbi:uncharacterized protein BJX67DRAFT_387296 [Aspergillus lucknowensis]|uniref:NAD(P)-binding domain-containing protein n=1 Tax=Aspergillus lucknowensis TaxID=176173 RepID=A0ABR4L5F5_9EURO